MSRVTESTADKYQLSLEPARRAASLQTCYKQRWTLSVTNFRPK